MKWLICLTLGLLFLAGCGADPEPRLRKGSRELPIQTTGTSMGENELRALIGLRKIEANWVLYRSDSQADLWKSNKTGPIVKAVSKDANGTPKSEDDYYYSGAQFTDNDGTAPEVLTARYDYQNKTMGLFYRGTNTKIKSLLKPVLMPWRDPSTNITEAVALARQATKDWPEGMKPAAN